MSQDMGDDHTKEVAVRRIVATFQKNLVIDSDCNSQVEIHEYNIVPSSIVGRWR